MTLMKGTHGGDSVDYPDFAHEVARQVADGAVDRGILVCGTGQGMAMAANKVPGVRAGVVSVENSSTWRVAWPKTCRRFRPAANIIPGFPRSSMRWVAIPAW
jgi:hypothetical protein